MRRSFLAGAAVAVALVLPACSADEASVEGDGPAVDWVVAAPYMPATTAEEWLSSGSNVVAGSVTAIGEPTRISEELPGSPEPFEAVVTLVSMRVDASPAGDIAPGSMVDLRILGGTADDLKFEWEGAPDISQLTVGSNIVAVAGPFESEERVTTFTPTVVFLDEGAAGYVEISGHVIETDEKLILDDVVELASDK